MWKFSSILHYKNIIILFSLRPANPLIGILPWFLLLPGRVAARAHRQKLLFYAYIVSHEQYRVNCGPLPWFGPNHDFFRALPSGTRMPSYKRKRWLFGLSRGESLSKFYSDLDLGALIDTKKCRAKIDGSWFTYVEIIVRQGLIIRTHHWRQLTAAKTAETSDRRTVSTQEISSRTEWGVINAVRLWFQRRVLKVFSIENIIEASKNDVPMSPKSRIPRSAFASDEQVASGKQALSAKVEVVFKVISHLTGSGLFCCRTGDSSKMKRMATERRRPFNGRTKMLLVHSYVNNWGGRNAG